MSFTSFHSQHTSSLSHSSLKFHSISQPCKFHPLRSRIVARSNDENDADTNVDWDTAWSQFRSGIEQNVEDRSSTVTTKPPSFTRSQPQNAWNSRIKEDIRRQERGLLDVWANENFSKVAIVIVMALLISAVVGAGPPPSDGRCTLPWC